MRKVVESYEELDDLAPCSFSLVSENGKIFLDKIAYVCHAPMEWMEPNKYDHLITSYPVEDPELDLKFFDFLKNRLYRNFSDHFHLEKTEDGLYYIWVSGLSKISANILFNFCIASRAIVEWRRDLKCWDELCEQGLNPILAFCVCTSDAREKLDKKVNQLIGYRSHWPLDRQADLSILLSGPIDTCQPYKEYPKSCTPTNVIWGAAKSFRALEGSTIREFCLQWKKDYPDHEDLLLAS